MAEIKVTYNGNMTTTSTCGKSPIVLNTDGSEEAYKTETAYTPVDMLISALGACMLSVMATMASKRGIDLKGTTANLTYTSDPATHRVATVNVTFRMPPVELTDSDKKMLNAAVRACPVGASLSADIKKEIAFEY